MAFRSKLRGSGDKGFIKEILIRNEQLPQSVAFKVIKVYRHRNASKDDGSYSNCALLQYKKHIHLKFYADYIFQNLNEEDIQEMNKSLRKENWFAVSHGRVGNYVVAQLLPEEELKGGHYEHFDECFDSHNLKEIDISKKPTPFVEEENPPHELMYM